MGQAFKQEDKWTIVKVLDLSKIDFTLKFSLKKYKEFSDLIDKNKQCAKTFLGLRKQVEYLRDITIDKLKQLIPTNRVKRGIINPLGSIIKLISGNLDHEDAIHYDSLITQLKGKQIATDKKMTIISKTIDAFVNSSETLQKNTDILNDKLRNIEELVNNVTTKESNSAYSSHILMMFETFNINFRSIYMTLSEIETALSLSKVSVLHQSILNSTELLLLLESIDDTEDFMFKVSASNLVKLERTIAVKAYIKGNQIAFILEIPLIDGNIYNYYKLYSLPIYDNVTNKTITIIPKFPYLMVKGLKYLPAARPCDEIGENQYLCTEDDIVPYTRETCVEQLMKFQADQSSCQAFSVDVENVKTQRIKNNDWIVYLRNSVILNETCGSSIIYKPLQGTYILHIDENCIVFVGNTQLHHRRLYSNDINKKLAPLIYLPQLKVSSLFVNKTLDIKNVNFDDLKQLSYILKMKNLESESVNNENISVVKVNSVSLATILLYIILPLCVLGYILFKFRIRLFTRNNPNPSDPDNFALGEGEVMHPVPRVIRIR